MRSSTGGGSDSLEEKLGIHPLNGVMGGGMGSEAGGSGAVKPKWRRAGFFRSTPPATSAAIKAPPVPLRTKPAR